MIATRNGNMAGLLFGEKTCLEVLFEGVEKAFLSERKGNAILCRRAEEFLKKKLKAREPTVESLVR